jgi:AraC-like DNA-binding protein
VDTISSDDIAPALRQRVADKLYENEVIRGRLEPVTGAPPRFSLSQQRLDDVRILSGTLGGVRLRALPGAPERVYVAMNLGGESVALEGGRELQIRPFEAVLHPAETSDFSIVRFRNVPFVGVNLPRSALSIPDRAIDDRHMRLLSGDLPATRLLAAYLAATVREELTEPHMLRMTARHIADLLSAALHKDGMVTESSDAARFRLVRYYLDEQLAGDLKVEVVAARFGVTARTLQKLFRAQGTTFSDYVTEARLRAAHRMLREPSCNGMSISTVALEVGFGDLSYFNRSFRRCFGCTPREVRAGEVRQSP